MQLASEVLDVRGFNVKPTAHLVQYNISIRYDTAVYRIVMEAGARLAENEVIRVIRDRRSVYRFGLGQVTEEGILTILEAGRWAPSWANTQPWQFIVVRDATARQKMSDIIREVTIVHSGMEEASVIIVISVDTEQDPFHYIEDGAVATQNMALAAHSLGYASYWNGIFDLQNTKGSAEDKVKKLLNIPENSRVIAALPIGVPAYKEEKTRRKLSEIIYLNQYGNKWPSNSDEESL
jgi:nitroreductase